MWNPQSGGCLKSRANARWILLPTRSEVLLDDHEITDASSSIQDMKRPSEDKEREDRFLDEVVVDAHGEEERAMGWYYAHKL